MKRTLYRWDDYTKLESEVWYDCTPTDRPDHWHVIHNIKRYKMTLIGWYATEKEALEAALDKNDYARWCLTNKYSADLKKLYEERDLLRELMRNG